LTGRAVYDFRLWATFQIETAQDASAFSLSLQTLIPLDFLAGASALSVDPLLPLKYDEWRGQPATTNLGGSILNLSSRILAAVDFSRPAGDAFEYALAVSKRHGAELVVLQAVPLDQTVRQHAGERLALTATLRQRADQAGVELTERVQQGDPAEIILLHARSLEPDLIVMGTQQRRGLDRLRMGSVAERVATRAASPLLLVPERSGPGAIAPFRHVAVAVDFSSSSSRAVEQALALASDADDRVTLLHVVPGFSAGVPTHLHKYGIAEYQAQLMRDARRRLQMTVPATRHSRAAINTRVLVGDTTTEITQAVHNIGADLLVVGVPTRGVVSRALFGTTAARLLGVTRVPVLAVPDVETVRAHEEGASQRLAA